MPFTQEVIEFLPDVQARRKAKFYNSLKIDVSIDVSKFASNNEALVPGSILIAKLAKQPGVAEAISQLKTKDNKSIASILEDVLLHVERVPQLQSVIDTLTEQPQTNSLTQLNEALTDYRDKFLEVSKDAYRAGGLYGCLIVAERALRKNEVSAPTPSFQKAILMGVVMPNLTLFDELEDKGDLTIDSLDKIELAKRRLAEAMRLFKKHHDEDIEVVLKDYRIHETQNLSRGLQKDIDKLKDLEEALALLQKSYRERYKGLSSDELEAFEQKINDLSKEVDSYKEKIESILEMQKEWLDGRMIKMREQYQEESMLLDFVFSNVGQELDYIKQRVKALDKKKAINEQFPDKSDKKQQRKRKKALNKVKEDTGLWYLLSDKSSRENKAMIKKYGGRLLYNLSQGRLAAMGHSEGLCGGYSAEFLLACLDPNWEKLTFQQKVKRFGSLVRTNQSFRADVSADITINELYMRLESGLRWDIQSMIYDKDSTLFEITKDDKSHATHKRKHRNKKAFFEKYVQGIMDVTDTDEPKQLMLTFFNEKEGHAVGLNKDKDGFLFHDSNTGYIHFKDPNMFAKFMVDYLYNKYSELTVHAHIYDFEQINRNLNKYNLKPLIPEKSGVFDLEALSLEQPSDRKMLKRMNTTERHLMQVQQRLDASTRSLDVADENQKTAAPLTKSSSTEFSDIEQDTLESSSTDKIMLGAQDQTAKDAPELVAPASKQKSKTTITTLRDSKNVPTKQTSLKNKAALNEHIAEVIDSYLGDHDEVLNNKQVLKQRVIIELNSIKSDPDRIELTALKRLCRSNNLTKCAQLVDKIEQDVLSKPKTKPKA